jgi:polyhydroxyalkanoate synthesis regulator phasin
MLFDDLRKSLEALLGNLTPANAQKLANDLMEPGAAKEQVAKFAADLLEWSQHNRDRATAFVSTEVQRQLAVVGVATRSEVDALKKRVRDLERAAGMTASGRKRSSARKRATRKKSVARKTTTPGSSAPTEAP